MPASCATSAMKSRVAPAPIGIVLVDGWPKVRVSQLAVERADLGVEHDVEVGVAQAREVGGGGAERRDDVDVDAQLRRAAA